MRCWIEPPREFVGRGITIDKVYFAGTTAVDENHIEVDPMTPGAKAYFGFNIRTWDSETNGFSTVFEILYDGENHYYCHRQLTISDKYMLDYAIEEALCHT